MHCHDIVLVLHNIRSRFNVGALFRTADAAGVSHMVLCGITPHPPHQKIDKVALGAERTMSWSSAKQTKRVLTGLAEKGYQVIALEQSPHSIAYHTASYHKKVALVVGNEVSGLPQRLQDACAATIEIPMHGNKESLNVGIAAGIILFHIINQ